MDSFIFCAVKVKANFTKKERRCKCFPSNFDKIFRIAILKNTKILLNYCSAFVDFLLKK